MVDTQSINEGAPQSNGLEPWLTGTHTDLHPVPRGVVHALELAMRDMQRWVLPVAPEQLAMRPFGLPSLAFQVRHIARSLDRLLTYAEASALSDEQLAALHRESEEAVDANALRLEFLDALQGSMERVRRFRPEQLEESRHVGRDRLPTTVAGLLVHIADHTQRHVGQAITTAKVVAALHGTEQS